MSPSDMFRGIERLAGPMEGRFLFWAKVGVIDSPALLMTPLPGEDVSHDVERYCRPGRVGDNAAGEVRTQGLVSAFAHT